MVADTLTEPVSAVDPLVDRWAEALDGGNARVVLADGDDPRAAEAAVQLAGLGITPVLVADEVRTPLDDRVEVVTPDALRSGPAGTVLAERLARVDHERARRWATDPLFAAIAAVGAGMADACVAGATRPTADVLRAALRMVGTAPDAHSVSSSFLMALPDGRLLAYGDCAVLPQPDVAQLAEVAVATSRSFATLADADPVVAMLSYSTKGSADHPSVGVVRHATELARQREPGLVVDGELQFDAAVLESVGRAKASGSTVAGRANVFIFPNLAAGNIGYKITERLAGARAYGPILQGLAAPVNDLSRGCRSDDIVAVAVISALQARAARHSSRSRRTLEGNR